MIISDKKIIIVALVVFIALIFGVSVYFYKDKILSLRYFFKFNAKYIGSNSNMEITNKQESIREKLSKTEFENRVPEGFLTAIPIEKGAVIEQSYIIDYSEQKQRTIVFESEKTLLENQKIYTDYLLNNQWIISHNAAYENLVSFYASKDLNDINIVIIFNEVNKKTKIDISVLEHLE